MRMRLGATRQPSLTQQHPGLDGLAETYLVGNQQFGRPVVIQTLKSADLMGPWHDWCGCFAHEITAR